MKLFSFGFIAVGFAGVAFEGLSATLSAPAAQAVCGAVLLALASTLKRRSATSAVSDAASTVNSEQAFRTSGI